MAITIRPCHSASWINRGIGAHYVKPVSRKKSRAKAEFGDFQTPQKLATDALELVRSLGIDAHTIIEPSCGKGAFVNAAVATYPDAKRVIGFEINGAHLNEARDAQKGEPKATLERANFFDVDWASALAGASEPILVIGNPPWVTSADLGTLSSRNLPKKSNFHGRAGIDAITGKSNFDISEWMLLRYLEWIERREGAIAVLCKTAVARKILLSAWTRNYPVSFARIYELDAARHFGAAVDACLLIMEVSQHKRSTTSCDVYAAFDAGAPERTIAFVDGLLVSDARRFTAHRKLLAKDKHYVWRSGIKHDCSKIMELKSDGGAFRNGLGESVILEPDYLYPMLKSSDVGNGRLDCRGVMLVTQRSVGEDTSAIRRDAPKTWSYLQSHAEILDRRGSSIYRGRPQFSIFGVGAYSFAPWKIAISGFYKALRFVRIGPVRGLPVVLDDTVNFLPCASESEADFLYELLTSRQATEFYESMVAWDEKRPLTVDLLRRLSLRNLAAELGRSADYAGFAACEDGPLFQPSQAA